MWTSVRDGPELPASVSNPFTHSFIQSGNTEYQAPGTVEDTVYKSKVLTHQSNPTPFYREGSRSRQDSGPKARQVQGP